MSLARYAVEKPVVPSLIGATLLVLGAYSLLSIPVEQTPDVKVPVVIATVRYAGAAPEEVETDVTQVLEDHLAGVRDLNHILGVSYEGGATFLLEFHDGVDPAAARRDVQSAADLARADLPPAADPPTVREVAFKDQPILAVSVTGDRDVATLDRVARDLRRELEAVPGVARTETFGTRAREILVEADPGRLSAHGLTLGDLAAAVEARGRNRPAGTMTLPGTQFLARTLAQPSGAAEVAAIRAGPAGIPLGDVASVRDGREDLRSAARVDGRDAVTVLVIPERGINTMAATAAVRRAAEEFGRARLPEGLRVVATGDASRPVLYMIRQLGQNAAFGAVVVVVLLVGCIGLRNSFLVAIAIPGSLLLAVMALHATGEVLSGIAIFSLILVLGMVVDGAIVVAENIHRRWEAGEAPRAAAVRGAEEVGGAALSSDLTTVAAFLPMILVVGVMGQFLSVLPKVVAYALIASLAWDHILLPLAASRVLPRRPPERLPGPGPLLSWFQARYRTALAWSLGHRGLVVGTSVLGLAAAAALAGSGALGYEFFPKVDMGRFALDIEMPAGTPVEETAEAARRIERLVTEIPRPPIESVVTTIGDTRALNVDIREGGRRGPEYAKISVELVPRWQRDTTQAEVVARLRPRLAEAAPLASVRVAELREGPPTGAAVAVRVQGDDLDAMGEVAARVAATLATVPGVRDVSSDYRPTRPEVFVRPRPEVAALVGVLPAGIAAQAGIALHGAEPVELTIGDERVTVRVRAAPEWLSGPEALADLWVRAGPGGPGDGGIFPLGEVADVRGGSGLDSVVRRDRRRTITVRADTAPGHDAAAVLASLRARIEASGDSSPAGVSIEYGGETEERDRSVASLERVMGLSILLILVILAAQFDSLRLPIVILATVPLSLIGVVFGLYALGQPLGFLPIVGIVALTGIVVNDAIVLVTTTEQRRAAGLGKREAIVTAGVTRLRPIYLTTATTVGGLLSLALNVLGGGEFWTGLAWTVISGVSVATLLTLIVVPVLYDLVARPDAA